MARVTYHDVASSNIASMGFLNGIGYVQFVNGRRFGYTMSKELFDQMLAAKSKGSFFARNVKGHCPVSWSGWKCDASPCKEDATLLGHPANDANAGTFRVCPTCAKNARFQGITFIVIEDTRA